MKFLLDEHVDPELGAYLENHGYEVEHVLENRRGDEDKDLMGYAETENLLIVTRDHDFLKKAVRQDHPGIVFLTAYARIRRLGAEIDEKMRELEGETRNSVFYLPE